ncbi:MAG: gamma-glutamyl-gamma-aminobutyrate hydrolase [Euryarchaeota archaeon]|nr:gamma-glutamyl-gamma-aminobutyrate hydrolase [Euryarchaeota archaeon]RCH71320.1 MAG: gamma-glutamyl-gamma-aminobutyrate hydrolase family protein [Candidatus Poseidoniales archaeon]
MIGLSAPVIGVTTSVNVRDYETPEQAVVMVPANYPQAIRRAGGIPILLTEGDDVETLLARLDGIIIAGGRDVDPARYGEEPHERTDNLRPEQDTWESALIATAIERDLPLLCVCRGHQLLAVERGGRLHQHLPETPGYEKHGATGGEWSNHAVEIDPNSRLGSIIGTNVIGNSGHHQGVADAGDLTIVGRTEDGLIEAVELPGASFLLSMQWHPEMLNQTKVFDALIEAARA